MDNRPRLTLSGDESRLKVSEFKLGTLLEITNAINNNLPESELFELFRYILEHQLNIGKALVFIKSSTGWNHALAYGVNDTEANIDVEKNLSNINGIAVMEMAGSSHAKSFDVVIPIAHRDRDLAYVLLGDINEDALTTSPIIKHLPFIQTIANLTVVAVENKRLNKETIKQKLIGRELEMASEMQGMLLPKLLPNNQYMQAAATYIPHQEVGGDFYDLIRVSDHEYYICVADVSGKGMSAAILMASFQAILRGNTRQNRELSAIANDLNRQVWANAQGERFITMFLGRYDADSHILNYINCAHPMPLLIGKNSCRKLTNGSVGLGMFEQLPFVNIGSVSVRPNDVFVAYTDGVNELENEAGIPFSEVTLQEIVEQNFEATMDSVNQKIMDSMNIHRGERTYQDDIALVSCRFL